jgi:penicillin-binding protein 1A
MNEIDLLARTALAWRRRRRPISTRPLDQLTPGEAAYLAALPKRRARACARCAEYDRAVERRNYVLREMWQNGYIDEATYEAEKACRC